MQDCTELKSWHLYFHCMNQQGSSPTYVIWKGTPPLLLLVTVKNCKIWIGFCCFIMRCMTCASASWFSFKVMDIDFKLHLKGTHVGNTLQQIAELQNIIFRPPLTNLVTKRGSQKNPRHAKSVKISTRTIVGKSVFALGNCLFRAQLSQLGA